MLSDFFKTYKTTLIKTISLGLLVIVVVQYINIYKRKLFGKLGVVERQLDNLQSIALENKLILSGYKKDNLANFRTSLKSSVFFVGHIYPQSEYVDPIDDRYVNKEHPLRYLVKMAEEHASLKIVFGGDNVQNPTSEALKFILDLRYRFEGFRFILGNHDKYWKFYKKEPLMKEIYPKRYFFEDENKIRFIYLHTILKNGKYGLDEEQINFLKESLKPPTLYKYALVFLHHNLWLGGQSTQVAYAESSRLKSQWKNDVFPLLASGSVKGVFSGDGGVKTEGTYELINGIPYFSTGWSMNRGDIPPEWLRIDLKKESMEVYWQKLLGGNLFVKKQLEK